MSNSPTEREPRDLVSLLASVRTDAGFAEFASPKERRDAFTRIDKRLAEAAALARKQAERIAVLMDSLRAESNLLRTMSELRVGGNHE